MAVGMVLYFASQGAGRVVAPVLAGTARLLVVLVGGVLVTALSGPPAGLFAVVALGFVTHGLLTAWAVRRTPWGAPRV